MNDLSWNNSSVGVSCDILNVDIDSRCRLQGNVRKIQRKVSNWRIASCYSRTKLPFCFTHASVTSGYLLWTWTFAPTILVRL